MSPWWAVGAGAVAVVSVLVIVAADRLTPRPLEAPLVAVVATDEPAPLASEPASVGASPLSPVDEVVIRVIPSSAVIELAGIPVAVGEYRGPVPTAEALVTLRAPGYVRHQFLLSGPSRREITLRAE